MNRKTLLALVAFVGLAAVSYSVLRSPLKGDRIGAKERPIPNIQAKEIDAVVIQEVGKTIELKREKNGWAVVKPIGFAADEGALKTLTEKVGKLEFGDLVTERKDRHADHHVDDKAGIRVTLKSGSKILADFVVGKSQSGYTMLRPASKDQVYQAVGSLRHVFKKDVKMWRNRTLSKFKREDARELRVETAGGAIVLGRKDAKAGWVVKSSTVAIDRLDQGAVRTILSAMASLMASDFADNKKMADTGLDKPTSRATAKLKDGKTHSVLVGAKKNKDEYWVKKSEGSQIYVLRKHNADNLIKWPGDFREKSVLKFNPGDVIALSMTKQDGAKREVAKLKRQGKEWLGHGGKKLKDSKKIAGVLKVLSTLRSAGFARGGDRPENRKNYGLDSPLWRIEIQLRDRTKHDLSIGRSEFDGHQGLRRHGVADIYTLRKHQVGQLVLEPKNFQ
jgi:hypothetical protein